MQCIIHLCSAVLLLLLVWQNNFYNDYIFIVARFMVSNIGAVASIDCR